MAPRAVVLAVPAELYNHVWPQFPHHFPIKMELRHSSTIRAVTIVGEFQFILRFLWDGFGVVSLGPFSDQKRPNNDPKMT